MKYGTLINVRLNNTTTLAEPYTNAQGYTK